MLDTRMADERTESEGHDTNGASTSRSAADAARAAFLAGDDTAAEDESPKGEVAKDDDSDLDEETERDDADDVEVDAEDDSDEDDDSDLDEDDEKTGEKVDADTAKRLAQVQRTDKRLREQRDRDFRARESELDAREAELKPHLEKLAKFERLAARASIDPVAVLHALGVSEDRFDGIAQVLYKLAKGKTDPKFQTEAAQLMKERERDAEIEDLKKWREERERADKESAQTAAADRELDAYFGKVTKALGDKTPLSKAYLKANPSEARERMQILAFRIAKETGALPNERAVAVALEKDRRRVLRELGIDPKSRGAAAASAAATDSKTKTTPTKKGDKKTAPAKADEEKLSPREAFLRGKYD